MSRIPEYSRQKFASSYVGGAQRDDSGALATAAIAKPVERSLQSQLVKVREQQNLIAEQQANNALIEFGLSYQQQMGALQKQFAQNPEDYPEAIYNEGKKLLEKAAENIPSERVRQLFSANGANVIRQGALTSITWVQAKQKENAALAIEGSARTIALTAGESVSVDALAQNLNALHDTVYELSKDVVDPAFKDETFKKYAPKAVEAHLYNRVRTEPQAVINDLKKGVYNGIDAFDDSMKTKFIGLAETRMNTERREIKEAQTDNKQRLLMKFISGQLTFAEVDQFETADNPYDKISLSDSRSLKDGLVDQLRRDATKLAKDNTTAKKYISLVSSFVDDAVDRAKFYDKIISTFRDGIISPEEAAFLGRLKGTLNTVKEAKIANSTNWAAKTVMKALPQIFKGVNQSEEKTAEGVQTLLYELGNNTEPQVAVKKVLSQAVIQSLGIADVSALPKEGMAFTDKNGKTIRVFPDGTYRKE